MRSTYIGKTLKGNSRNWYAGDPAHDRDAERAEKKAREHAREKAPPPPPPRERPRVQFADEVDAEMLGLRTTNVTRDELKRAYKKAIFSAHPDRGGSTKRAVEINSAFARMKKRRGFD